MKRKKYSQNFPKKSKLNNYAPSIPYYYNYIYNMDIISSQKLIGKMKYYEPKEHNILGDNCSYKKIEVLPAVELNHIHSNNLIIFGERALCSSFTRYRNKFITLNRDIKAKGTDNSQLKILYKLINYFWLLHQKY